MLDLTRIYLFVFGVLAIAGGIVGFVKAQSRASLIAGGISGLLLLVAGYLMGSGNLSIGLILGIVVSVALAGRFVPSFIKTKKVMPAGLMALLSVAGIVLTALGFLQR
jgi:uncharacterized membrane protein (UPF0136 family)